MTEALQFQEDEAPRDKLISIDAEQMVLGCILMNNEAFHKVDNVLSAEDFSEGLHQRIYTHCTKLIEKGGNASPLTLGNYLDDDPAMQEIGTGYLANLAAHSIPASVVMDYATLIRSNAVRRGICDLADTASREALHSHIDTSPEVIVERLMEDADALLSKDTKRGAVTFSQALREAREGIEEAYQSQGVGNGMSTGMASLDPN